VAELAAPLGINAGELLAAMASDWAKQALKEAVDAAVAKAYGGKRTIEWKEVLAGEKAFNQTGNW